MKTSSPGFSSPHTLSKGVIAGKAIIHRRINIKPLKRQQTQSEPIMFSCGHCGAKIQYLTYKWENKVYCTWFCQQEGKEQ